MATRCVPSRAKNTSLALGSRKRTVTVLPADTSGESIGAGGCGWASAAMLPTTSPKQNLNFIMLILSAHPFRMLRCTVELGRRLEPFELAGHGGILGFGHQRFQLFVGEWLDHQS